MYKSSGIENEVAVVDASTLSFLLTLFPMLQHLEIKGGYPK